MKLSCTQENLTKALGIVVRSVSPRTTLPVLNNILLKTEKGRLKISATDLEIGIHTWIGAKIDQEGAITCPARLLTEYVNTNTDKKINLEVKDSTLHLESDHFKASIKGIDASEFPLIPEVKKTEIIEISAPKLAQAINQVVFAAATDETRPVLAGVLIKVHKDKLKIVATDSYRLAEYTINTQNKISNEISLIVPQRAIMELGRVINEAEEKVLIYPGDNQVEFVMPNTVLVSRLIEGMFPDYEQIIPTSTKIKIKAEKNEFANAIKMASFFARESANNIKLNAKSPDKLKVSAISPQLGENVSDITAEVSGDSVEIAFNAKFILDVLQVLPTKQVALELSSNLSPGLLKGLNENNYIYVIMPLRIEE
jgi:DNA polymerase-3 subunit beta